MNPLPVISVRKSPRFLLRARSWGRKMGNRLSPLEKSVSLRFRRMWRQPRQRKIFLGAVGATLVLALLFATARLWPVADNQFSTNPLRPGVVLAHLPEVDMRVEARTTGQTAFSVSRRGSRFEFAIPGNAKVLSQKDSTSLTFRNQAGQEVHYSLQNNGIKEQIKLFEKSESNTFSTQIRVNNVYAKSTPTGALYFYDKNDNYQFHIEAPYALDATGNTTWGVSYRLLDENGKDLLTPEGEKIQRELLTPQEVEIGRNYQLQTVVNEEWLFAKERQYPIIIDPTVIHDTSSEFSSGIFSRTKDTGSGSSPVLQTTEQELTADVNTVGLWHFNEGTTNTCTGGSNDACDASGKGNDGAFQSSASFSSTSKLGSHSLSANGTGNYLRVPSSASLNPTSQITVEAWVNTTTTGTNATIVSKSTGCATTGYLMWLNQNSVGAGIPSFWIGNGAWVDGTYAINDGNWHHVAGVFDGSTVYVYVDGRLVNSAPRTGSLSSTTDLGIGQGVSCGSNFGGLIDEVRISNVARSAEYIAASASRPPSGTYTSPSLNLGAVTGYNDLSWTESGVSTGDGETLSDATSLVAQWNFNNTSGTTLTNNAGSCGATCNGTLTNFASTGSQDAAALTGWTATYHRWGAGALMFDGTNDYVSVPDNSSLDFGTGNFTVSAWVKTTTIGNQRFVYKYNTDTTRGFSLQTSSGDPAARFLLFGTGGVAQGYAIGKTPINDGQWHHIVGVRDGSNTYLYVDGKLDATATGATADVSGNSNLFFGSDVTPANFFKGTIDAASIYSRALSAEEIAANAQVGNIEFQTRSSSDGATWEAWSPTSGETSITTLDSDATNWSWDNTSTYAPVSKTNDTTIKMEGTSSLKLQTANGYTDANTYAYWKLDETSGTGSYLQDSTANNRDLTPTNGPTVTQGISGKARRFDGSNDYLGGSYGVTGTSTAIDLWFRTTSTTRSVIFGQSSSAPTAAPTSYVPAVTMLADGTIRAELWTGTVGAITSSKSYNDGRWHHLVLAGTAGVQALFIDGETIGNRAGTLAQTWWTYTTIGAGYDGTARGAAANAWTYFNGDIDEVRIASTVLSTDAAYEAYRLSENHTLQRTVSSTDLSGKTSIPFYIAADRPGTYLEMSAGISSFSNYRTDASTVGLWELDEEYGSSNYAKDGSGNANHGTPTNGPSSTDGVRGKALSFDGSNDYLITSNLTGLSTGNATHTIEAWIKPDNTPTTRQWPLLLGNAASNNHHWTWSSGNVLSAGVWGAGGSQCSLTLPVGSWTYVVTTFDGTTLRCYLNGQLAQSVSATFNLAGVSLKLAQAQNSEAYFAGDMDQVRISSGVRSAGAIRQTYEISQRTHPITIDFGASLDSGNLIANSGDTSFTIDARTRGLVQRAEKIFSGEKIIVRENVNGTEYIAQATVNTVNASTGAITTASWDSGSTFPSGGYTVNADVFKWQREYWNIDRAMDNQVNGVQSLNLRITNGDEGRTVWLDDLRSSGGYMSTPGGNSILSTAQQYFQYRAIFTGSSKISPQLMSVSMQYDQYSVSDDAVFAENSLHDKLKTKDTTPTIAFLASQSDGFDLVYEVQWDNDADFVGASSAVSDANAGFVNTDSGGDTSPFNESETVAYTWQSALTNGNTYFYRVRAKDVVTDTWGNWSETRSLTIDTSLVNDGWFETHADQFATDDAEPNILVDDAGNFVYIDPTGAPAFSRPITITNSGAPLTNHHTLLTIDTATLITAGKVQSDCDDLRFYDSNDAQLTYWIENGCNTSSTKIWVQVPSLPTGDTNITMYYGNSLASQGSASYSGNMIGSFDGTCPVGWTAMSTLNTGNYYIRGGTSAVGTTGGSTTHSHTVTLTTGGPSATETAPPPSSDNDNATAANHTHSWTGSTGTATNAPPYYDLVFCQYTGIPADVGTSYVGMFSSTPSGWTRFSSLDNRFMRANTSAGGTGGSSTHTHSLSGTFPATATQLADNGNNDRQVSRNSHTHSFSTTTGSASSLPSYYTSIFAKPNSTANLVEGQIAMMSTNTAPPLGWTRYTALDNTMPYGGTSFAATGGSDTNTHAVSSFTTGNDSTSVSIHTGGGSSAAETSHNHSVTATNTNSANILPPYYTMSFYQRKSDSTTKAIGSEVSSLRRLLISTPIEAEIITSARWNEFSFNDDTTDGNISYRIYYDNGGSPELVPDAVLPGNTAGFTSSPVDLSPLSVEDYPILYLGADMFYSNGTPELHDWQITFNEPPETPTLIAPNNTVVLNNLTPTLQFSTTDFESDYVRYKIEICTNASMDMGFGCQTFDQTVDQTNFGGQNAQTGTAYTSGSTASYTFSSQLPINTTYYWRVYAIDPGGSDWWSGTQSPVWSFTTPNLVRPQMCLLEESRVDSSIIIRWDDPNVVETGYEVERDVNGAGFSAYDTTAADITSLTDLGIGPDNSYQYRIRGLIGTSYSDWCTTPLLDIETGNFQLEGVRGEGLRVD